MSLRRIASLLLLAVASHLAAQTPPPSADFAAAAPAQPFAEPLAGQLAAISAPALAAHINYLASPALEGRGLGERGLDAAAEYIVSNLQRAGVTPFGTAGDANSASWFQSVPLRRLTHTAGEIEIERHDRELTATRTFSSAVDCLFAAIPPQTLRAPVVFAGYGIREPQFGRDDYAGLDVRGRLVMVIDGLPQGGEWQKPDLVSRWMPKERRTHYAAKLEEARKLGAAGVLAVEEDGFAVNLAENAADARRDFMAYDHEPGHELPPLIAVSRSVACAVIGEEALDAARSGAPRMPSTAQATATIRVTATETLLVSRNVIGILRGSEPGSGEAVVIGAHYDHLGAPAGVLHPGADDNASGTAALLEIAKTFAAAATPPKRTIVFAFWTGEEEGRFGSDYYAKHSRWPLDHTPAYLNLDMIGHPWLAEEIRKLVTDAAMPDGASFLAQATPANFVEPGVPRGVPALEAALRRSASGNGLAMHIDWTDGKNGGSDYRGFARKGVPFIRFFGNFFPDYHKPGDTPAGVDPAQVQRVARFAYAAAWELANR